ncbi:MAG: hypothetical protein KKG59_00595 [Nanoarchaeota archaeon]|nr:hypothetical protein [Nanoarchaeota archaeon]
MADKQFEKLRGINRDVNLVSQEVAPMASAVGVLDRVISEEYLQRIQNLQGQLSQLQTGWRIRKRSTEADTYRSQMIMPYLDSVLESLQANVLLAREGDDRDSTRLFELRAQVDQVPIEILETALEDYHVAVEKFFGSQRGLVNNPMPRVHSLNVRHYADKAGAIKTALDEQASRIFGRIIHTESNFDVKERSPHHFLGQINVGYEHAEPNLVRITAHEGPFGHNTHYLMSDDTMFGHQFVHSAEGLAILGENLAISMFYGANPERADAFADFYRAKRIMDDALGAAYEFLAFHERQPVGQIASKLDSRYLDPKILRQNIRGLGEQREAKFSFGASPYFAGAKLIGEIHTTAMDTVIDKLKDPERGTNKLMRVMYSGLRPAHSIATHVKLDLEAAVEAESLNGETGNARNGYSP